ncbi:hypothetical protein L6164_016849 [Bauhinia variegata]|uniref:Uncharacterized protein n=1 Tax=Bauhinia variegata TaxID=167791 RepID=A0ACB9N7B4_BAUVA|nr:hypothetical protein L6164_016849 [Bauhinia variegata]
MASPHGGKPLGATEVGSYFVAKYYQALMRHPQHVHEFYSDHGTMIRVDGESSHSAATRQQIHKLILSLNYKGIEITTINSLDSWIGGLLVMVSGNLKINDINDKKKFVQTFFLAPQENGYFVLNDILQFNDDAVVYPNGVSMASEKIHTKVSGSLSASDICLEEASKLVESVIGEDDSLQGSSPILGVVSVEKPLEEPANTSHEPFLQLSTEKSGLPTTTTESGPILFGLKDAIKPNVQQSSFADESPSESMIEPADESFGQESEIKPLEESANKSYASVVQFSTGKSALPTTPSGPTLSELSDAEAKHNIQKTNTTYEGLPKLIEPVNESFRQQEGEIKSVFVKNLPTTVTAAEIEKGFSYFGKLKPDSIFIKEVKEFGACYALVDFEDVFSAQNALQASPIEFGGRDVYILKRRPNSGKISWEGRKGKGRSSYQTDAPRWSSSAGSLGKGSN